MSVSVKKSGHYELIETTKGHQILNLNDEDYYALVKGEKGDIAVKSGSDHKKKKLINHGKFYFADFYDDPDFNDVPHLFLQDSGGRYREWILPNGLPSSSDHQKKLVRSDRLISKNKVERHLEGGGSKCGERQAQDAMPPAGSQSESRGQKSKPRGKSPADKGALESKTKSQLYQLARRKHVEGRSKMSKEELVTALS